MPLPPCREAEVDAEAAAETEDGREARLHRAGSRGAGPGGGRPPARRPLGRRRRGRGGRSSSAGCASSSVSPPTSPARWAPASPTAPAPSSAAGRVAIPVACFGFAVLICSGRTGSRSGMPPTSTPMLGPCSSQSSGRCSAGRVDAHRGPDRPHRHRRAPLVHRRRGHPAHRVRAPGDRRRYRRAALLAQGGIIGAAVGGPLAAAAGEVGGHRDPRRALARVSWACSSRSGSPSVWS